MVPEVGTTAAQRYSTGRVPIKRRAQVASKAARGSSRTTAIPAASDPVRDFADGIKLAINEYRGQFIAMIVEAHKIIEGSRNGPPIEYNERQHVMKIILEMSLFVVSYAVITVLVFGGMAVGASNQLQLGGPVGLGYLAVCIGLVYFAAREYYKWSHLYYVRVGGVLKATRPKKNFFFLTVVDRNLNLRTVVGISETATWIMRVFGISRIIIELQETNSADPEEDSSSEDDNSKKNKSKWRKLSLMRNGERLIATVNQGSNFR
jgi:hypothetical protein